jgi:hypothetical protein
MNALLSNRKENGACVRDSAINTDNATRVPYQQAEWRYHLDRLTLDICGSHVKRDLGNPFSDERIAFKWNLHKQAVKVYAALNWLRIQFNGALLLQHSDRQ